MSEHVRTVEYEKSPEHGESSLPDVNVVNAFLSALGVILKATPIFFEGVLVSFKEVAFVGLDFGNMDNWYIFTEEGKNIGLRTVMSEEYFFQLLRKYFKVS